MKIFLLLFMVLSFTDAYSMETIKKWFSEKTIKNNKQKTQDECSICVDILPEWPGKIDLLCDSEHTNQHVLCTTCANKLSTKSCPFCRRNFGPGTKLLIDASNFFQKKVVTNKLVEEVLVVFAFEMNRMSREKDQTIEKLTKEIKKKDDKVRRVKIDYSQALSDRRFILDSLNEASEKVQTERKAFNNLAIEHDTLKHENIILRKYCKILTGFAFFGVVFGGIMSIRYNSIKHIVK